MLLVNTKGAKPKQMIKKVPGKTFCLSHVFATVNLIFNRLSSERKHHHPTS